MTAASDPVVIVSAARTPLGRFMGELSPFSAHQLGSHVIGAAVERAKLSPERIDEVFMGCVLPAGQGQAPARQAARGAKLPDATGATTVNKVCGSGMKATMLAHDIINAGSAHPPHCAGHARCGRGGVPDASGMRSALAAIRRIGRPGG